MKLVVVSCSAAALLAACGGGDLAGSSETGPVEATSDRAQAQATASGTVLANEYQSFTLATTSTVRYGAGSSWVQRSVSGRAACTNEFFGSDPAFMVLKRCELVGAGAVAPAPAPIPAPAPAPVGGGWSHVANEGQSFAVSGTRQVRYGAGNAWLQRSVSNGGACGNGYFGSDPAFMVFKRCEVWSDAATAWAV